MTISKSLLLNWSLSMRNKSERFETFLIDFESQIQALFDDPCEHLWMSNQENIFLLLTFLLKWSPCWLTSAKLHHCCHTKIHTIPCVQKQWYRKEIKMAEWKLAFFILICILPLSFGGKNCIKSNRNSISSLKLCAIF